MKDGSLDYADESAQLEGGGLLDSLLLRPCKWTRAAMTELMLAAIENPYTQIIAHPTGRLLLRRDALDYDIEKVSGRLREAWLGDGVQFVPDRLDLQDVYLRMCKSGA